MSDDSTPDEGVVTVRSADEAFGLLGNEIRIQILQDLYEADGPASFSQLHGNVDANSSKFNYHLQQLAGVFVTKTEDGYELTAAGHSVVGGIVAGEFTKDTEEVVVDVGSECRWCSGPLAGYFGERIDRICCRDCERNVYSIEIPPGTFETYDREQWPVVAERWTRHRMRTLVRGFCYRCHGPIQTHVERDHDRIHDIFPVGVGYDCGLCGMETASALGGHLVGTSPVVAFHEDHGVDVAETPIWELGWPIEPRSDVVSEDPLRVAMPVELDDRRLVVTVDESGDVVESRREPIGEEATADRSV